MCITFFSIEPNKNYKFIMLFNRDEFLARKTLPLDFHFKNTKYKDILFYPLDCTFEGTFLCINTKNGNFCCLLNNTLETVPFNPYAKLKRGDIPLEFCQLGMDEWEDYFKKLENNKLDYNGFNLICGNFVNQEYCYYTNNALLDHEYKVPFKFSDPGVYGVSNSFLSGNSVYNDKVSYGKKILREILEKNFNTNEKEFVVNLFQFMGDKNRLFRNDENVVKELEKNYSKAIFDKENKKIICSSLFVEDKIDSFLLEYGTRHTICILCDYENNLSVYEYFDQVHYLSSEHCDEDKRDGNCEENNFKAEGKYFLKKRNLENLKQYKFVLENEN